MQAKAGRLVYVFFAQHPSEGFAALWTVEKPDFHLCAFASAARAGGHAPSFTCNNDVLALWTGREVSFFSFLPTRSSKFHYAECDPNCDSVDYSVYETDHPASVCRGNSRHVDKPTEYCFRRR